ncbi:MAG: hypothetical protein HUK20_00540 [Fibrobacter sp.]|nr:hypothetical protein [Fibrobacter sp.]
MKIVLVLLTLFMLYGCYVSPPPASSFMKIGESSKNDLAGFGGSFHAIQYKDQTHVGYKNIKLPCKKDYECNTLNFIELVDFHFYTSSGIFFTGFDVNGLLASPTVDFGFKTKYLGFQSWIGILAGGLMLVEQPIATQRINIGFYELAALDAMMYEEHDLATIILYDFGGKVYKETGIGVYLTFKFPSKDSQPPSSISFESHYSYDWDFKVRRIRFLAIMDIG